MTDDEVDGGEPELVEELSAGGEPHRHHDLLARDEAAVGESDPTDTALVGLDGRRRAPGDLDAEGGELLGLLDVGLSPSWSTRLRSEVH